MILAGYIAYTAAKENAQAAVFTWKWLEGKEPLRVFAREMHDNIKMGLTELRCKHVYWIDLVQGTV